MSHRPVVLVSGLTIGDYMLWSWSLNGNHDVLALVAGLTLPPLAVTCLWLLALSVARLLASVARRPGERRARGHGERSGHRGERGRDRRRVSHEPARQARATAAASEETLAAAGSSDAPSRTLAA